MPNRLNLMGFIEELEAGKFQRDTVILVHIRSFLSLKLTDRHGLSLMMLTELKKGETHFRYISVLN